MTKGEMISHRLDQTKTLINVALKIVETSYLADKDSRDIVNLLCVAYDELDMLSDSVDEMIIKNETQKE